MSIQAHPLQWPEGWQRTVAHLRVRAKFGTSERRSYEHSPQSTYLRKRDLTVSDGLERILSELGRMGVERDDIVISTNLSLRLDGLPRSNQSEPQDPGAAVYWVERWSKGSPTRCMAIDRYERVADNLGAIAATLDAMRAIERHGGAEILNRAFTGFTALPAPGQTSASWREVLGLNGNTTAQDVEAAYRRLRSLHHPDKGGSADMFHAVQSAYEQAKQAVGGSAE